MNVINMNKEKLMTNFTDIYFKIFPQKIMRYHSYRIDKFIKSMAEKNDGNGKKVLDVGAQNSPYRKYFKKSNYFSQDIEQNGEKNIDFIGDVGEGISEIKDSSFDFIICTQVLEHLKEPKKAFHEFNRILKKDGQLFLTTHLCFEEHMIPNDFFRFTKYGLRYLGEPTGFNVVHISPHGGIFQLIALIFDTLLLKLFFKQGPLYYLFIVVFTIPIFLFNSICYLLDYLDRDKIMTINYECVYKKI